MFEFIDKILGLLFTREVYVVYKGDDVYSIHKTGINATITYHCLQALCGNSYTHIEKHILKK